MKVFYDNCIVNTIEDLIIHNKYKKALFIAKKYVQDYPNDSLGPIYLARCKVLNGDTKDVIKDVEYILASKLHHVSSYVIGYTWYGFMLSDMDLKEQAKEMLEKAVSYEEGYSGQISLKARMKLANMCIDENKPEEALKWLDDITVNNLSLLHNKKAFLYIMLNKPDKALNELRFVDIDEMSDELSKQQYNINCGMAYRACGNDEAAIEHFKNCLTCVNKYYSQALKQLALIAGDNFRTNDAITYALKILDTKYCNTDAYIILGKEYLRKGCIDEAAFYINSIDDKNLRDFYMIMIHYSNGEFEKALEMSEHLLSICTDDKFDALLETMLHSLIRLGRTEEAFYKFLHVKGNINPPGKNVFYAYFNKELNIRIDTLRYYSAKQLSEYDEESAIDHIYDRHKSDDINDEFGTKENIKELLKKVRNVVIDLKPKYENMFDKYIYEINPDDRIGVVTLPNSVEVLTMYRLDGDTIYNIEEENKETKQESQVDKFYKRYGFK